MTQRMNIRRLIVFSGLDGAGKSTQIELLIEYLQTAGQQPIYLWSRGGYTPLFNTLKSLLRRLTGGKVVPASGKSAQRTQALAKGRTRRLWLTLALLDLILVYGVRVRWWLWRGNPVICDRFLWDTLVDFRLNFPRETVEQWRLWRLLVRATPRPDAAFLLLIPVEESVRRSDIKGEPFRDSPAVLAERLAHYQTLAQSGYWQVLDGQAPVSDLFAQIQTRVSAAPQPVSALSAS